MSEIGYEGPPPIDSYGGGGFRISGGFHAGDLLIPGAAPMSWSAGLLAPSAFDAVFARAAEIDVLLIGMGEEIAPLPPETRMAIEAAGVGVETMSTPSACRTYNVLLSEGRRIAAALKAI